MWLYLYKKYCSYLCHFFEWWHVSHTRPTPRSVEVYHPWISAPEYKVSEVTLGDGLNGRREKVLHPSHQSHHVTVPALVCTGEKRWSHFKIILSKNLNLPFSGHKVSLDLYNAGKRWSIHNDYVYEHPPWKQGVPVVLISHKTWSSSYSYSTTDLNNLVPHIIEEKTKQNNRLLL